MAQQRRDATGAFWVADVLPQAHAQADWRRVRGYYEQHVQMGDIRTPVPIELCEGLANSLLQASASYSGCEERMCEHALAVLADVDGLERVDVDRSRGYYEDERLAATRRADAPIRQPGLMETVVETCRRRRDVRSLREVFKDTPTSGLIIGSTVYGPYYNVRGNRRGNDASDLDCLIIVEDVEALDDLSGQLAGIPCVAAPDLEHLGRRARIFADRLYDGRTVFSHKIGLWGEGMPDNLLPREVGRPGYPLSLHIMTRSVLDHIVVAAAPRLVADMTGTQRTVQDYREVPRALGDVVRTFAGRRYDLPLATVSVEQGCVRSPRVYYIDELGAYCPGFYQMMLIPQPTVPWDSLDIRPALDRFRAKLAERVRHEAERRPFAMLRPSFAHIRRDAFAPQIVRSLDDGY